VIAHTAWAHSHALGESEGGGRPVQLEEDPRAAPSQQRFQRIVAPFVRRPEIGDSPTADRPVPGYPAVLRCDNGPEFACAAVADWAGERVGLHFIPPGQPWRNGYIESFNSRVRDEASTSTCSGHWFRRGW